MEVSQEALQARVEATANEVRAFARGYASAVEAHCLSLLRHLEELRVQRRYDDDAANTDPVESVRFLEVTTARKLYLFKNKIKIKYSIKGYS